MYCIDTIVLLLIITVIFFLIYDIYLKKNFESFEITGENSFSSNIEFINWPFAQGNNTLPLTTTQNNKAKIKIPRGIPANDGILRINVGETGNPGPKGLGTKGPKGAVGGMIGERPPEDQVDCCPTCQPNDFASKNIFVNKVRFPNKIFLPRNKKICTVENNCIGADDLLAISAPHIKSVGRNRPNTPRSVEECTF